ncbi:hypothetical protein D3C81_2100440 [compost metagenome]
MLLAILDDLHNNFFSRQYHWFHRICQIIDIKYGNTLKLTNLVEIKIIGHDFAAQDLSQLDQLAVYFGNFFKIPLVD